MVISKPNLFLSDFPISFISRLDLKVARLHGVFNLTLETALENERYFRHTFSEHFGLCLNMYLFHLYSLLSSPVFRAQMMSGCWVEL